MHGWFLKASETPTIVTQTQIVFQTSLPLVSNKRWWICAKNQPPPKPIFFSSKILINIQHSSYQISHSYLNLTKCGTTLNYLNLLNYLNQNFPILNVVKLNDIKKLNKYDVMLIMNMVIYD